MERFSRDELLRIIIDLEGKLSDSHSTARICSQCGEVDDEVRECVVCGAEECQNDHRKMLSCVGCGDFVCEDHERQSCADCESESDSENSD